MPMPYLACMLAAAQFYHLPPRVLPAIHAVEGGFPGAIHPNRDGSDDLGVMQINTRWVAPLTALLNRHAAPPMAQDVVHDRLVTDSCFNIAAAAAIVQAEWLGAGQDWLRAVGNYHSHTPHLHDDYLARVTQAARTLFGP
jgi:hypothetical protein